VTLTTISRANHTDLVSIYERFAPVADMCIFYLSWWIDQEHADRHTEDYARRFGEKPRRHYGWIGEWSTFNVKALSTELDELRRRARGKNRAPVYVMPDIEGETALRRYYTEHGERFGFTECSSIYTNPEIDSDGSLSPCRDYHDYVVGNVRDKTITELWNNDKYVRFRKSISNEGLMPVCSRCCGLMGF
jgi:radical SAM protein with 4Fe4S-binding SPASM domain